MPYRLTWVSLTLDMGYLFTAAPAKHSRCSLPWMKGISSHRPSSPSTWDGSSKPSCAHTATSPWMWGCPSWPPPLALGLGLLLPVDALASGVGLLLPAAALGLGCHPWPQMLGDSLGIKSPKIQSSCIFYALVPKETVFLYSLSHNTYDIRYMGFLQQETNCLELVPSPTG